MSTTWAPRPYAGRPRTVVVTRMQRNVLESVCEGKSNRLIGADWGISDDTVKTHVKDLLRAAGARDRLHLGTMVCRGELLVTVADHRRRPDPEQTATLGSPAAYCPAS